MTIESLAFFGSTIDDVTRLIQTEQSNRDTCEREREITTRGFLIKEMLMKTFIFPAKFYSTRDIIPRLVFYMH